jgi:hypothetical protein
MPATARQACQIIDLTFRMSDGTTREHAHWLRRAGMIPSTQGIPSEIDNEHIALILLSVMTGLPAHSSAALIAEYADMRPTTGGDSLVVTLARFLTCPHDLFELKIDNLRAGASIVFRGADSGMQVASFSTQHHYPRPAFERVSIVGAHVFTQLSQAIATAEPPKLGRRRTVDRYRRHDHQGIQ